MKHFFIFATLSLFVALIGCSGNPPGRFLIEGTVTLDGKPLEEGKISFEPVGEQTLKVRSGALIQCGKYRMPAASGLVAREYLVQIVSQKETGNMVKVKSDMDGSEQEVREMINLIPPEQVKHRITVTEKWKQTFGFEIKTK